MIDPPADDEKERLDAAFRELMLHKNEEEDDCEAESDATARLQQIQERAEACERQRQQLQNASQPFPAHEDRMYLLAALAASTATVEQLRQEREAQRDRANIAADELARFSAEYLNHVKELEQAEADLTALRAGIARLAPYLNHKAGCRYTCVCEHEEFRHKDYGEIGKACLACSCDKYTERECVCGLSEQLAALTQGEIAGYKERVEAARFQRAEQAEKREAALRAGIARTTKEWRETAKGLPPDYLTLEACADQLDNIIAALARPREEKI